MWALLLDKLGKSFFDRLRAQDVRRYGGAIPATQALGAGEGTLMLINTPTATLTYMNKGVPIGFVVPDLTTGVETHVLLTARAKSRHPNAARLLAAYVLSPAGNSHLNGTSAISVYQTSGLPNNYQSPDPDSGTRKAEIINLLGF